MNFRKAEPWIFRLLAVLHLWPVFYPDYFVTHDGPAHVYNAALIRDMFFSGNNASGSHFFEFNAFPFPNWSGHAFLVLTGTIVPAAMGEKLLVAACILLMAFSFRDIISRLAPGKEAASWMIFPFLHGFLLYMGFYNFCLGAGLLLFSVSWWMRNKDRCDTKKAIVFFLLMLLLYFSHLFIFFLFMLFLLLSALRERIASSRFTGGRKGYYAGLLIPLLLSAAYLFMQPVSGGGRRAMDELLLWLVQARPLITLNYEIQMIWAAAAGIGILLVFIFTLVKRLGRERALRASDTFLFTALGCLILYFILPDSAGEGGFISVRLLLFFYIFILLWTGLNLSAAWLRWTLNLVCLAVSVRMLFYHTAEMDKLGNDVTRFMKSAEFISPGQVVLPLNYSDNWLHSNISSYLGAEADALLLDNYEASKSVFPLRWKEGRDPYRIIGGFSASVPPCGNADGFRRATGKQIDAIVMWKRTGQADSCTLRWDDFILKEEYRERLSDQDLKLLSIDR